MFPPTPTPLPPGIPVVDMGSYSLWPAASPAIQAWNWMGALGTTLQLIIIAALVIAGVYTVMRFVNQTTRKDAES